ncbi:L-lactate MFS transporter [Sediminitomix flava]|uniref:OFA family oxalate/formate antiporter-like MFS transporter n=1 Tax=Sediminitomix flava TaxID=379075 RepID=A0A315Z490_SEDFL|nr:OFA family MFS transporter [Sediminitomix flava]PWJ37899.1 OFA family oxalate/formate antiporter-like MFS transporter [Sediminitomix flava]
MTGQMRNRWLIAASAVGIHTSIGAVYAYSVLKAPLLKEVGWAFKETAWAFSIVIICMALSAAFLGRMVERIGPRKSSFLAAAFYGAGFMIAGLSVELENLYLFFLGYGVIGGIGMGIGYISPVATLVKWFPDRRGLATGLAIMGFGFGSLVASNMLQYFMSVLNIPYTLYLIGAIYLTVMVISAQYLAPPPEGWAPKGFEAEDNKEGSSKAKQDLAQLTSIEALKTKRFYYLWVMFFITITCGIAIISVAAPLSQDVAGLGVKAAATMVGTMGLINGLGRIGWASFSDMVGRPVTYTIFFIIQAVAFMLLPQATDPWFFQLLIFVIISCYGGVFATIPAYIGDIFGTKNLSAIHGNSLTAKAAAGLVGPQLAAYVKDLTGSYTDTMYIFSGLFVIAIIVSIMAIININKIRKENLRESENDYLKQMA